MRQLPFGWIALAAIAPFVACSSNTNGPDAGGTGSSSSSSGGGGSSSSSGTSGGLGGGSSSSSSSGSAGSGSSSSSSSGAMTDDGGMTADAPSGEGGGGGAGCAAAKLCDDFEGAAPGTAGSAWTFIMKGGYTIALDTTQFHSGKNSVHATFTAAAGYAYISETKTFPATDFWGRAFMRFMAPPGGHQVFAGSDTAMDEATGDQMRYMNDMGGMLTMNIRSTDAVAKSTKALPMGTWNCYEWHQTTTTADLYIDGAMIGTAMGAGFKGLATPYVAMVLGGERFGGGVAGDVWIDDVAVDTAQIGCK